MIVNSEKFEALVLTKSKQDTSGIQISLKDHCIATQDTVKLMGITIDLKVNRQRSTSVMRRPKLKIPSLEKCLISPLVRVIIKICKSTLCSRPTAIFIFIVKHEFLYNNSCKPVCKLFPVFQKY